jgi:hypothetical protein
MASGIIGCKTVAMIWRFGGNGTDEESEAGEAEWPTESVPVICVVDKID